MHKNIIRMLTVTSVEILFVTVQYSRLSIDYRSNLHHELSMLTQAITVESLTFYSCIFGAAYFVSFSFCELSFALSVK